MGVVTNSLVSLLVVSLKGSFVSDRQTSDWLTGRCFNGVWQGVVGFVLYIRLRAAAPRYRRHLTADDM